MSLVNFSSKNNNNINSNYTNNMPAMNLYQSSSLISFYNKKYNLPEVNYALNFNSFNQMFSNYMTALSKNTSQMFKDVDFSNTNKKTNRLGGAGLNIVNTAEKYIGYKESDGSFKRFTNGKNHAWCADFASYVVKETFENNGRKLPSDFGSSSVEGLRQWGKKNNCYLDTTGLSNKPDTIKNEIKSGDIVIFKENGRSHTGIVKKINSDGSFETIEGNASDKVASRNYTANNKTISGFVQVA